MKKGKLSIDFSDFGRPTEQISVGRQNYKAHRRVTYYTIDRQTLKNMTPDVLLLQAKFCKIHCRVIRHPRVHFCLRNFVRTYSKSYSHFTLQ